MIRTTLLALLFAGLTFGQETSEREPKFLTVGEIEKIDLKAKSITLRDATAYNIAQLSNEGTAVGVSGGRTRGSGGAGAGGGGRGGGRRGGGGGGGSSAGTRGASVPIPMEYKIVLSSATMLTEDGNAIKLEDLKIGDTLEVFSMKGGTKVDATKIIRTMKKES